MITPQELSELHGLVPDLIYQKDWVQLSRLLSTLVGCGEPDRIQAWLAATSVWGASEALEEPRRALVQYAETLKGPEEEL